MSTRPFILEALVDFPDDAFSAPEPISADHLDSMMAGLARAGVRRVSFQCYGYGHGGYFIADGLDSAWTNYARTLDLLGNPLQVAVDAGHRHGLEVYGYFKPYETGLAMAFPEGAPESRAWGRLWRLGGYLAWLEPFVIQHPELRIRRNPTLAPHETGQQPIAALRLTKKDDAPTRVTGDRLQIWTSQRNYRYRRLEQDVRVDEAVEPATGMWSI